MRGKKIDTQFLTDFISQCVIKDINTPDKIAKVAQVEISDIDEKIRQVEELKIRRSKLLDIIATFQNPTKNNREEVKILSFFSIQNPHICKLICDAVKEQTIKIDQINNLKYSVHDVNFCIKQLIEHRVIAKIGNSILRGEMFHQYLKFVLQEE